MPSTARPRSSPPARRERERQRQSATPSPLAQHCCRRCAGALGLADKRSQALARLGGYRARGRLCCTRAINELRLWRLAWGAGTAPTLPRAQHQVHGASACHSFRPVHHARMFRHARAMQSGLRCAPGMLLRAPAAWGLVLSCFPPFTVGPPELVAPVCCSGLHTRTLGNALTLCECGQAQEPCTRAA